MTQPVSPYAAALGDRRNRLAAPLQRYFDTIPDGYVGRGEGVFHVVGTPRKWLWPLLRPLQRSAVVPAGFWLDVPFTVVNRTIGERGMGVRTFHLPNGDFTMTDIVARSGVGTADAIGTPARVSARFDLDVRDEKLLITSRRIGLRIGRLRLGTPPWFPARIRIVEYAEGDGHGMSFTLDLPLIGRVYEYRGSFRSYRIEKEES